VRIVYLGTPADAVPPLHALVEAGHDVAFVVTQPDRRRSRGAGADPTPVKRAALAFGQLLPGALLDAIPNGFVNMHFSLLPRWRGAAPVERAILAGDTETGVSLMQIEAGLDTGPVYASTRVPIGVAETAGELHARLVEAGTGLLMSELPNLAGTTPVPQSGEPTYADKLTVEEFELDLRKPAVELARIVRAGNPRPGAWFRLGNRRVKVWRAHEEPDGTLALDEVQPEGKQAMDASAWRAGLRSDGGLPDRLS